MNKVKYIVAVGSGLLVTSASAFAEDTVTTSIDAAVAKYGTVVTIVAPLVGGLILLKAGIMVWKKVSRFFQGA